MEAGERFVSVVYRLYPNATQRKILEKTLEYCRVLYNILLEMCITDAIEGIHQRSRFDMGKTITELLVGYPEMKSFCYSTCLRDVGDRVVHAMKGCRWTEDGKLEHLPRFKSRNRYDSFAYHSAQGFSFEGDRLKFSKIGSIRYRNNIHPKHGVPKKCTIHRDARGRWYAIVVFAVPDIKVNEENFDNPSRAEAYDLGVTHLVTDTRGNTIDLPDYESETESEVKRLQTIMSNSEEGSERWEKARIKLATIKSRNARRRRAFLHRTAHDIVDNKYLIVLEDLRPKKMMERKDTPPSLREKIHMASWATLINMIECKAEWAGIEVISVNPRNTSRRCSACGNIREDLKLSDRTYSCPCCGLIMDRDRNAAINILGLGMETVSMRKRSTLG